MLVDSSDHVPTFSETVDEREAAMAVFTSLGQRSEIRGEYVRLAVLLFRNKVTRSVT